MSTMEERRKRMWKNYNGHKGMTFKEQVEKLKEDKIRAEKDYKQKIREERSEYYRTRGTPLDHFERIMSEGGVREEDAYNESQGYRYD